MTSPKQLVLLLVAGLKQHELLPKFLSQQTARENIQHKIHYHLYGNGCKRRCNRVVQDCNRDCLKNTLFSLVLNLLFK